MSLDPVYALDIVNPQIASNAQGLPTSETFVMEGVPCPGKATLTSGDSPRAWEERQGNATDGATLVPAGERLGLYVFLIELWTGAQYKAWPSLEQIRSSYPLPMPSRVRARGQRLRLRRLGGCRGLRGRHAAGLAVEAGAGGRGTARVLQLFWPKACHQHVRHRARLRDPPVALHGPLLVREQRHDRAPLVRVRAPQAVRVVRTDAEQARDEAAAIVLLAKARIGELTREIKAEPPAVSGARGGRGAKAVLEWPRRWLVHELSDGSRTVHDTRVAEGTIVA